MLMQTGVLIALMSILTVSSNPIQTTAQDNGERTVASEEEAGPVSRCQIQNTAFQDGETIVYKLYYNWKFVWLSAGEVTFKVRDLGSQYHLSADGNTYKSYEWFYKVRDKYDTYVDKETLLPIVSIRDIHEGSYTLYDKIIFDKTNNVARSLRGRSRKDAEWEEYDVESCMHDMLSIVYFSRNLNFDNMEVGREIPIKIFMDEETWPLKVVFKGKESEKKIKGMGKFNTLQFSPEVISGYIFDEGDEMNIWVSDDKNRIPLQIESPVSVGSIKAVLKEYNGLRYDLAAKIEE